MLLGVGRLILSLIQCRSRTYRVLVLVCYCRSLDLGPLRLLFRGTTSGYNGLSFQTQVKDGSCEANERALASAMANHSTNAEGIGNLSCVDERVRTESKILGRR